MTYYKSARHIDGKARIVITDENGTIIDKNPTKELIALAIPDKKRKPKGELENRTCCICGGKDTHKNNKGVPQWLREYNIKGWTGRWMCFNCGSNDYQEKDPNSQRNAIKSVRNPRIGNIKKGTEQGMVIITQAVVAKVNGIEDLNIRMDNYGYHFDMYKDVYGRINVEYSSFRYPHYEGWIFNSRRINIVKTENYDTFILLCFNEDKSDIERIYIIINNEEIKELWTIGINANGSKYEKFRVDKSEYSSAYRDIMLYLEDREYFGIDDIMEWMNTRRNYK